MIPCKIIPIANVCTVQKSSRDWVSNALVHCKTLVYWLFYDVLLSFAIIKCLPFVKCTRKCTFLDEGQVFLVPLKHIERVQEVSLQNLSV